MKALRSWEDVLSANWNQNPVLLKGAAQSLRCSAACVFAGLVTAAQASRDGDAVDMRLFQNGALRVVDREPRLPRHGDMSPPAYISRLRRELLDAEVCLIVRDIQVYAPELFERLRDWLTPILRRVGFPERTIVSAFVGNYRITPFGVHTDADHTLFLPIEGRKRFLVWPPAYGETHRTPWIRQGHMGSTEVRPFSRDATSITCHPGDAIYLPPHHWHCALSPRADGLGISLGLGAAGPSVLSRALAGVLDMARAGELHALLGDGELWPDVSKNIRRTRRHARNLSADARIAWLAAVSARGMAAPPPRQPLARITRAARVSTGPHCMFLVKQPKRLVCVGGGYATTLRRHRSLEKALDALLRSGTTEVGTLEAHAASPSESKVIRNALRCLHAIRAVTVE